MFILLSGITGTDPAALFFLSISTIHPEANTGYCGRTCRLQFQIQPLPLFS
jgi:hypothetical protein